MLIQINIDCDREDVLKHLHVIRKAIKKQLKSIENDDSDHYSRGDDNNCYGSHDWVMDESGQTLIKCVFM